MKSLFLKPAFLALTALGFILQATSVFAQPDASGTWTWSVTRPDGQAFESKLEIQQTGNSLTGTYHSSRGGPSPIQDGKITGDEVSFKITRQFQDRDFTLNYTGKLQGDRIVGKAAVADGDRTFDWLAQRQSKPADPAGTWTWTTTRRDGQQTENKLKITRENSQLKGALTGGRNQENAVQDLKLTGKELSFRVTRQGQQGRTFTAQYKGTLEGDVLRGTIDTQAGDQTRSREWTAKRAATAKNVTGDWDWSVALPDGQSFTALLSIEVKGNDVIGKLQGDDWEVPIQKGTLEGSQIAFVTTREQDGRTMTFHSKAAIAGNEMNGTVEYKTAEGEVRIRDWKATRRQSK